MAGLVQVKSGQSRRGFKKVMREIPDIRNRTVEMEGQHMKSVLLPKIEVAGLVREPPEDTRKKTRNIVSENRFD